MLLATHYILVWWTTLWSWITRILCDNAQHPSTVVMLSLSANASVGKSVQAACACWLPGLEGFDFNWRPLCGEKERGDGRERVLIGTPLRPLVPEKRAGRALGRAVHLDVDLRGGGGAKGYSSHQRRCVRTSDQPTIPPSSTTPCLMSFSLFFRSVAAAFSRSLSAGHTKPHSNKAEPREKERGERRAGRSQAV